MKVTRSQIKTLSYWGSQTEMYKVLDSETQVITVHHKIPQQTAANHGKISTYLKGYEKYYDLKKLRYNIEGFVLKEEYYNNRPEYTYTTTCYVYDIELTDEGRKEVSRRYEIHKRNMEKYARMLG